MNIRRLFRFSLGMLLFLTFCIAGFFAGYHYGRQAGFEYWQGEKYATESYRVTGLLPSFDDPRFEEEVIAITDYLDSSLNADVLEDKMFSFSYITSVSDEWVYMLQPRKHVDETKRLFAKLQALKRTAEEQGKPFIIPGPSKFGPPPIDWRRRPPAE